MLRSELRQDSRALVERMLYPPDQVPQSALLEQIRVSRGGGPPSHTTTSTRQLISMTRRTSCRGHGNTHSLLSLSLCRGHGDTHSHFSLSLSLCSLWQAWEARVQQQERHMQYPVLQPGGHLIYLVKSHQELDGCCGKTKQVGRQARARRTRRLLVSPHASLPSSGGTGLTLFSLFSSLFSGRAVLHPHLRAAGRPAGDLRRHLHGQRPPAQQLPPRAAPGR